MTGLIGKLSIRDKLLKKIQTKPSQHRLGNLLRQEMKFREQSNRRKKSILRRHGCSNHSNLEMEAEYLTKTLSYLNLNISRTKNDRNKL